ncbi:DNA repair protein RecN [bacterium]|nr:DNA repair protein RecN [bacterium]
MLLHLSIHNFALIEKADLDFTSGFTVLSGETGAGKSILIEALGLMVGEKANTDIVRHGFKEAVVEGVFQVSAELKELLETMGLDEGNELIIRRHVALEGRSKIFANGKSLTLSQLQEIGPLLIDISGQHENQVLLNPKNYISILDKTALSLNAPSKKEISYESILENYRETYSRYTAQKKEVEKLYQMAREKGDKFEFLKFQLQELDKAGNIDIEEEDKLLIEKKRVKNAEALHQLVSNALTLTSRDDGALGQVGEASKNMGKASQMDESLNSFVARLDALRSELEEIVGDIESYSDKLSIDPARLDVIESRLYLLFDLKRKYGPTLEDVVRRHEEVKKQIGAMENSDDVIREAEKTLQALQKELIQKAALLTASRKKLAQAFEKQIQSELKDLAMPQVKFSIHFDADVTDVNRFTADGADSIRFLLSANPGEPLKPIAAIASGGELSRILLAVKKVLTSSSKTVTFIFDEIDTGIGGAVAATVGLKLKQIAKDSQVLVVTHLPQVASLADHHFSIEKQFLKDSSKTLIRILAANEREEEIARMLGGLNITDKTRAHARDMLKTGRNFL